MLLPAISKETHFLSPFLKGSWRGFLYSENPPESPFKKGGLN
jgi:hypothetical protein